MKDIASDLKERFDHAAYWYSSAWEFDPDASIVNDAVVRDEAKEDADDRMVQTFEALRDSVDAIPPTIIAKAEELRASIGAKKYDKLAGDAIANVGRRTIPKDAAELLEWLNSSLHFT